jgi:TatD DNase family protein
MSATAAGAAAFAALPASGGPPAAGAAATATAATAALPASGGPPCLQFTDIAVNLTDPQYTGHYNGKATPAHPPDLQDVLARAAAAGVTRIIVTGTDLPESRKALALARAVNASGAHPALRLYSTVGLHPTSTSGGLEGLAPEAYEAALLEVARDGARDGTVVFVGECGLDFDRLHFSPEAAQRAHFPMHLRLAAATGLPLFLHDRATHGALLALIAAHGGLPPAGGVVHSFTGTPAELAATLAAHPRLWVGINGCALKTPEGCAMAASVPLQRLLLETDAPWCGIKASSPAAAHVRSVGRAVKKEKWEAGAMVKDRNEPCNVVAVAEAISGLRGVEVATVCEAVEANLKELLRGLL